VVFVVIAVVAVVGVGSHRGGHACASARRGGRARACHGGCTRHHARGHLTVVVVVVVASWSRLVSDHCGGPARGPAHARCQLNAHGRRHRRCDGHHDGRGHGQVMVVSRIGSLPSCMSFGCSQWSYLAEVAVGCVGLVVKTQEHSNGECAKPFVIDFLPDSSCCEVRESTQVAAMAAFLAIGLRQELEYRFR
jgi:hypothetical protein